MADYQSRYTGPQIDNLLDAVNTSLMVPDSNSDSRLVGYRYEGFAIPSTIPNTTGAKIFYMASQPGTYTNFNGIVINQGEVAILRKNASNAWVKEAFGSFTTFYTVCETQANVAIKDITLPYFELNTSIRLLIKMNNANNASGVTLRINNSNSATLLYKDASVSAVNTWKAGEVLDIYYNGTNYVARAGVTVVQTTGQDDSVVMSQKAVTDELTAIKETVWPLTITFTNNSSSPVEFTGTPFNTTLTWTCKRNGVNLNPSQVVIKKGSTILTTIINPGSASGTYQTSVTDLGANTYTVEITADGMTKTTTTTVTTVLPMYVGFYAHGTANANTMKGSLTKKVITSVSSLSGTYNNSTNGYDLVMLVPSDKTISSVKSNGFDVPMLAATTDTTIEVPSGTARSYKIYRSASSTGINAGNMTIVVA